MLSIGRHVKFDARASKFVMPCVKICDASVKKSACVKTLMFAPLAASMDLLEQTFGDGQQHEVIRAFGQLAQAQCRANAEQSSGSRTRGATLVGTTRIRERSTSQVCDQETGKQEQDLPIFHTRPLMKVPHKAFPRRWGGGEARLIRFEISRSAQTAARGIQGRVRGRPVRGDHVTQACCVVPRW